jgi:hypothetical protein
VKEGIKTLKKTSSRKAIKMNWIKREQKHAFSGEERKV